MTIFQRPFINYLKTCYNLMKNNLNHSVSVKQNKRLLMSPLGKRGRRFINILPAISLNYAISWSQGVATPPAKRHRLEGNPRPFGKKILKNSWTTLLKPQAHSISFSVVSSVQSSRLARAPFLIKVYVAVSKEMRSDRRLFSYPCNRAR